MFEYKCKLLRVVDGDTIDIDIDLGFGVWLRKQRIRMYGIDSPESRTRDLEEKKYGLASKKYLKKMCSDNDLLIRTKKDGKGKFGRILGEMWRTTDYTDKSINQYCIDNYHAVAYYGQSKEDIEQDHLNNRKLVTL